MGKKIRWFWALICLFLPGLLAYGEENQAQPAYEEGQAIVCMKKNFARGVLPDLLGQAEFLMNVDGTQSGKVSAFGQEMQEEAAVLVLVQDFSKSTEEFQDGG